MKETKKKAITKVKQIPQMYYKNLIKDVYLHQDKTNI